MVTVKTPARNHPDTPPDEFQSWLPYLAVDEKVSDWSDLKKLLEWFDSIKKTLSPKLIDTAWEVATLLIHIRMDEETICAALCRNVLDLKDTDDPNFAKIDALLGERMGKLLRGMARISLITQLHEEVDEAEKNAQSEIIREMLFAVTDDIRVVLVTLVEQLCMLRELANGEGEDRIRIAQRVYDIFAPISNLLGVWQLKWELEDLSFRILQPKAYRAIAKSLAEKRIDREKYINRIISDLNGNLKDNNLKAEVVGRPKHIVSIWRKMQRKQVAFGDIYDIRAVRVLVDTVPECYAVLGIVHSMWPHIKSEFDDYIAVPKGNNYRSLHTAVIGPEGKPIEIQVRTHEMDHHSELGVAAHWRYKDGTLYGDSFIKNISNLRTYLDQNKDEQTPGEILRQFSTDTLDQRVYAITPKGRIIDLPKGATPLDFAYHIHSEIGHRCRGAKVNGRIVPLTYALKSGERVEVLTHSSGHPSPDWLNESRGFVKTGRARSRIRAWFREQGFESHVQSGRQIVERELRSLRLTEEEFIAFVARSRFQQPNEYYAAVGRGDLLSDQVANSLQSYINEKNARAKKQLGLPSAAPQQDTRSTSDVIIEGVGHLLSQMARCCQPAPYDPIIGYITQGRGVTIHRVDCPNIRALREEEIGRLVEADWACETNETYQVGIYIQAYDRHGLLNDLTSWLAQEKINVLGLNTRVDPLDQVAHFNLVVDVSEGIELQTLINKLRSQSGVIEVRRDGSALN